MFKVSSSFDAIMVLTFITYNANGCLNGEMDVEECFTSIDHCTDGLSDEFRMLKAMNHKMTSDDCKQSCLDQNDVGTQIKRDGQLPEIVYCQAIFYNPPSTCKLYYEVKNAKSAKKQQLRTTGKSNECSQMKIGCGQNESSKKRLSFCPKSQSPVILKTIGIRQRKTKTEHLIKGIFQRKCYDYCTSDVTPDGRPFKCGGVNFEISSGNCQMLEEAVSPLGNGSIIKDRGFVHYDKLCLPTNLAKKCPGLIERKLRKTLVGFNMQVITTSYSECIEKCFRESDKCKSAMYYVSNTGNCVLNFEDETAAPKLLVDDSTHSVEYIDFQSCSKPS